MATTITTVWSFASHKAASRTIERLKSLTAALSRHPAPVATGAGLGVRASFGVKHYPLRFRPASNQFYRSGVWAPSPPKHHARCERRALAAGMIHCFGGTMALQ